MTWTEAQSYCRANYTDLASVRNVAENQKIQDLVSGKIMAENRKLHNLVRDGEAAWIGLSRDSWKWSDGSNSTFRLWKTGEPDNNGNEACGAANFKSSGQWEDIPCDVKIPFICYSPLPKQDIKVFKLRVKSSSSLDLNDPAVLENMLLKIKQKLRDQGLDDNIKVTWNKQPDGKVFYEEKNNKKDEFLMWNLCVGFSFFPQSRHVTAQNRAGQSAD
ncbi:uncharacterized protein LOC115024879 [Cottoperca gobio]|uniref:Uncharacterized protein LOC115024879 n=1 Tax=Cottoperca gobio TaxID=56716 RepID=A0A6J2RT35_COTGO|nr:uncharacterized protein LOC115024879 [Cottoperca gobio]